MNRLPQKKKTGDPILAADWNLLLDAIAARTPRPGTGLELIASSGGFAYSSPANALIPRVALPPFSIIGLEKAEDLYAVTIQEGWVIERTPKVASEAKAVKFHMPVVAGEEEESTELSAIPRPKVSMSLGDTVWCKIKTDVAGEITEPPEIVVSAEDQDGTHYQPEDPDETGTEGEYYIKLLKLEDDEGSPRVVVFQDSDIEHWAQLWTGDNLGGGGRIFKEHNDAENIYKFRTVRGDYGIVEDETNDEVELDFWGENAGEGCPVWIEPMDGDEPADNPPDGPCEFRGIAGRGSDSSGVTEQIHVRCEPENEGDPLPETIRVVGNEKQGALVLNQGDEGFIDLVRWDDGLVTNIGEFTLKVQEYKVCEDGYPKTVKFIIVE